MPHDYNETLNAVKAGASFNNVTDRYEHSRDALCLFRFVKPGYGVDLWGKILKYENMTPLTLIMDGHHVPPGHIFLDKVDGYEVIPAWKGPANDVRQVAA